MKSNFICALLILLLTGFTGIINAQDNSDRVPPQYLFTEFSNSIVKMKNGTSQSANMNYNMVTEKMVYIKDDKFYDLVAIETVDTVFIQKNRFVPVGQVFHEVVIEAPISFFIQHKGEIIVPGAPAAYGGTSQVSSSKYLSHVGLEGGYYNLKLPGDYTVSVKPVYWIRKANELFSFMNERQFMKIFPDKANELRQFLKKNRLKFERKDDLIRLINHCNELVK